MKSAASSLATVLVVIIVLWIGLKLLGVAFKAVGLLLLAGAVVVLYFGAQRLLGKGR